MSLTTVSRQQVERLLTEAWRDLLDAPVRPDEDVFDLGAHSLLAAELVTEMRRSGVRVTVLDIFDHPTPAGLARFLVPDAPDDGAAGMAEPTAGAGGIVEPTAGASGYGTEPVTEPDTRPGIEPVGLVAELWRTSMDPRSPAVPAAMLPLIAEGRREPLFCVPAATGHVRFFAAIAESLRMGRPVYGFEPPWRAAPVRPALTVAETAERYLSELRGVQPHGPYHLTGFCSGALTALEMAHRLRASGEQVRTLVLAGPPANLPELDPGWGLTDLTRYLLGSVRRRFGLHSDADLPRVARELADLGWFEEGLEPDDLPRRMVLWAAELFAQEHYEPLRYDGPATVVMYGNQDVRGYWLPRLPAADVLGVGAVTTLGLLREPAVASAFRALLD